MNGIALLDTDLDFSRLYKVENSLTRDEFVSKVWQMTNGVLKRFTTYAYDVELMEVTCGDW